MIAQEPVLIRSPDSIYDSPADTLPSSGWEHIYIESTSSSTSTITDRWRELNENGTTPLSGFTIDRQEEEGTVSIEKPLTQNTFLNYLNLSTRNPPTPIDILMFEGNNYKWLKGCVPDNWDISISEGSIVTESVEFIVTEMEPWITGVTTFPVSYNNVTETPLTYGDISYDTIPNYVISEISVSISNSYSTINDPDSNISTEIDTLFFTDREVTLDCTIVTESMDQYDEIINTDTYIQLDLGNFDILEFKNVVFPSAEIVNEIGSVRTIEVGSEPVQMK